MTQREFLNAIITGTLTVKVKEDGKMIDNSKPAFEDGMPITEIVEFAQTLLNKLNEKNKKRAEGMTEKQKDNENVKNEIIAAFQNDGTERTAKMVADEFELKSTQYASALLKQLVDDKILEKYTGKLNSSSKVNIYRLKTE